MGSMNAITIHNLTKVYATGTRALKGINLEVKEGDFFALLGANGAGKTTTIGILTGLVNKTAGQCKIFQYDIDKDFVLAKQQIGLTPQEFNFNIFEKVIDIVIQQAGYHGISKKEALPRAHELLEQLGLGEKKLATAQTLSGGLKRRLMIARALIHKPRLLFLDEPTAGVDVELRNSMWDYLKRINEEEGVTILLTTHYLEEVEQLCKNVAMIKEGEIVMNDTVKNVLRSAESETYTADVRGKIPENFGKNGTDAAPLRFAVIDEHTIEIDVPRESSMHEVTSALKKAGLEVESMRPKGNRLESLFLNVLHG